MSSNKSAECASCKLFTPRRDAPNTGYCDGYGVPVYASGEMADCERRKPLTLAERRMEAYR